MNPLTLVKRIQKINSREAELGISDEASWHSKYKDSAYVFVGGVPFDLTEGDLLAVFAQYGEIVDVNLVRDKATGKSKGFAFIAYEDQRSTNLAVDNLNGASVLGRIIRVDHVSNYKKKEEEDEEKEQQKREERGVCRAFQRGECNRGAACKFSHNEQRCANTGWGPKDDIPKWGHDKYDGPSRNPKSAQNVFMDNAHDSDGKEGHSRGRMDDKDERKSRVEDKWNEVKPRERWRDIEKWSERPDRIIEDRDKRESERRLNKEKSERNSKEDRDRKGRDDRLPRHVMEENQKDDHHHSRREREARSARYESELNSRGYDRTTREQRTERKYFQTDPKEDRDRRGVAEKRSRYDRDSSSRHHREEAEMHQWSSHK